MILSLSNWFDSRLISFFGLAVSPGTFIFPLTFSISSIITNVYGYKYARRAIHVAFLFNTLFIIYGQILIRLPSPSFSIHNNEAFTQILNFDFFIILGSLVSYLVSEPLNTKIVAKLKIKFNGQFPGLRFIGASILASGVDTLIFTPIAFGTFFNTDKIITMAFNIWLIKSLVEIIALPFALKISTFLEEKEKVDNYDTETDFSFFKLETNYLISQNKYKDKEL